MNKLYCYHKVSTALWCHA